MTELIEALAALVVAMHKANPHVSPLSQLAAIVRLAETPIRLRHAHFTEWSIAARRRSLANESPAR